VEAGRVKILDLVGEKGWKSPAGDRIYLRGLAFNNLEGAISGFSGGDLSNPLSVGMGEGAESDRGS